MSMAADSNMNFHHEVFPSLFRNQHEVSFQLGTINSTATVVQGGINCSEGISSRSGMMLDGKASILNNTSSMMVLGNSSNNMLIEPTAGLKHDTGLAADWSNKEQAILNHELIRYADQPTVMKYVKIAALLPEKTVRDVALRCQWMSKKESRKRLKLEDYFAEKKLKYMKGQVETCSHHQEKMLDSSTNVIHPLGNVAGYPFMMHHVNHNNQLLTKGLHNNQLLTKGLHNNQLLTKAPVIDDVTRQLMEENAQVFSHVAANLGILKMQDNVNLFLHTRNNIRAILNSMSGMPGIMSQMPPLPVTINEDLLTTILPKTSQEFCHLLKAFRFSSPTSITVKKEPRS